MTKTTDLRETTSVEPAPKPPKKRERPSKTAKAKRAAVENPWPDDKQAHPQGDIEPGSEPLHNPKQERFAQNIAGGLALHEAYHEAGYKGDPSNARRLRDEDHVWLRIDWLKREIGKVVIAKTAEAQAERIIAGIYTKSQAMVEADKVLALCMALGQGGPAVRAIELKCRLEGIPLDRNPTQPPDEDGTDAREREDPAVVEAFARMGASRVKLLAHLLPPPAKGTKVSRETQGR